MNYQKIYDQLINKFKIYQSRYEAKKHHDCVEKHHIFPTCLGGTNDPENLVFLSAKAHFIAHYLLTKIYPNNRDLWLAIQIMAHGKDGKYKRHKPSAKIYEMARRKCGELFVGTKMSEEARAKISAKSKLQVHTEERRLRAGASIREALAKKKELTGGIKSPARIAADEAARGKKVSEETRKKMSERGKGRIFSEEHRANLAKSRIGKTHSNETRANIKKALEKNKGIRTPAQIAASEKWKGHKISEETRKKLSEMRKGKPKTEQHKENIRNSHLLRVKNRQVARVKTTVPEVCDDLTSFFD